jgi:hypothetical protein
MSDIPPGARAPVDPYATTDPYSASGPYDASAGTTGGTSGGTSGGSDASGGEKAKQVAQQSKQAAGQAAGEVKETAKDQAQRVASEAKSQVRNVASDVRDKVSSGARSQNDKLVGSIRQTADQLDEMRGERQDGPAAAVVSRVAEGGRQFADYLDRNGPEGVLEEVQEFARRRPGTFLATALVAGFVVGRLGKGIAKADSQAGKPSTDSFSSTSGAGFTNPPATPAEPVYTPGTSTGAGYPATDYPATGTPVSTEYASTGTGTPVVVEEDYVVERPEPRP